MTLRYLLRLILTMLAAISLLRFCRIILLMVLPFSAKAIDLPYVCETHQGDAETLFGNSLLSVKTAWKVEAIQVCKTNLKNKADKANYVVFSQIELDTNGICTFKAQKAFWQGQKPSWPSDLKDRVIYGRAIEGQCLGYSSPLAYYISLSLLPENINRAQFFGGLMTLFDLLNGGEKGIAQALSSLSVWQKWFCEDCLYFKALLLRAVESKDALVFIDSITTVIKTDNPDEEVIVMTLYINKVMFQVFISYKANVVIINDISVVRNDD